MAKEYNPSINLKNNKPKKVRIVVEKVPADEKGRTCNCHQEGQVFEVPFERCPANFCAAAFHSLWPMLRVIELGGRHPWDGEENVTRVTCVDPEKPVVFRIEADYE
ncbi:MAG: TIGR04076 family protein [Clostridiales bacterium]|nr:TIGR04076 family protein [Clostridiales bacterium]